MDKETLAKVRSAVFGLHDGAKNPTRRNALRDVIAAVESMVEHADDCDPDDHSAAHNGIVPCLRYDFVVTEIGYQCDVFQDLELLETVCRDFGGGYPEGSPEHQELLNDLHRRIADAVRAWCRAH